jgi:hypothetical protein
VIPADALSWKLSLRVNSAPEKKPIRVVAPLSALATHAAVPSIGAPPLKRSEKPVSQPEWVRASAMVR